MCTCITWSMPTIFLPGAIGCLGLAFLLYGRNRSIRRIGAMLTGALGLPMAWLSAIYGGAGWDQYEIRAGAPLIVQAAEVAWWSFQHSNGIALTFFLTLFVVTGWFIATDTGVNFFDDRGYSGSRFFSENNKSQEVKVGCIFFSIGFLVLSLLITPLLSVVSFLVMELTHYRVSFSQTEFTANLLVSVLLALALSIVGLLTVNAFEAEHPMQKVGESDYRPCQD